MFTRKSIIKQTIHIGGSTLLSRMLGLVREVLMANYLGPGVLGEAFITAFKIPNSLRKIFAEGALSVAFIPTFVSLMKKDGQARVSRLTTLSILLFEGALFAICVLCIWKADLVIRIIMPGWFAGGGELPLFDGVRASVCNTLFQVPVESFIKIIETITHACTGTATVSEQVPYAITFLRILMGFILLLSTSALLAGALQAAHHFFLPAFSPVLLNIFFIGGLVICMQFNLLPSVLCGFIMLGGVVQLLLHIWLYKKLGFNLTSPTAQTRHDFQEVWTKFLPCLLSMSIMELYLFVDTSLGSYLPTGSVALIYYANRFMQIPLSVIATALSTILLPYFARVGTYAPRRLGYYLFESAKVIVWTMAPVAFVMALVRYEIFYTLFLSAKFTQAHVVEASAILLASLGGIIFFALNKILLNVYYGLHDTKTPMYISIICIFFNGVLSYYFMLRWGAYGIALGTTFAGILQTMLSVVLLKKRFKFSMYSVPFVLFLIRCATQLCILGTAFFLVVYAIKYLLLSLSGKIALLLLRSIWFWIWYLPLTALFGLSLFKTRSFFGIQIPLLEAY